MKKLILIGCLMLTNIFYAQNRDTEKWRNDLDYLVKRIEVMHPNPYVYCTKEEFYRLKENLYNEIPKLSDVDAIISISELLASLKDGHTRWAIDKSDPNWLTQTFHLLPIIQYPFEDGTYILASLPQYKELVGKKVKKIGKLDITEIEMKLGKIWSHDNASGELKYLYYTLGVAEMLKIIGAIDDTGIIEIIVSDEKGREKKVTLTTVSFMSMAQFLSTSWYPQAGDELVTINQSAKNPLPLWLKNLDKNFWFEYVPDNKLMYLQINSLNFPHSYNEEEGSFNQLCKQFFKALDQSEAERLVIDIRANNGGNHVELPLLKGIIARPQIDQKGKLFLVTGRVTYSAAVHFATVFKKYTNVTIIGEPASGRPNHYGAVRSFQLPNHPYIKIDCSIDYYQDSEPFDFNIINAPEVEIKMTAANYKDNIDQSMEVVKNYEKITDVVKNLTVELEQEYTVNGLPGFKKQYYAKNHVLLKTGYSLENFFGEFRDWVRTKNKNNPTDLLEYLLFAVDECPESIDLCYSLAVQLESQGQFEDAKRRYSRCLQLNPAHHYAKMKLGLIKLKDNNLLVN